MNNKTWSIKQKTIEISGKVIHGEKYGRKLGFPTANLDRRSYSRRKLNIKLGVYAGCVAIEGRPLGQPQRSALKGKYSAAIVIGPLDNHHLPKIEAHLLNFKGNLYGKKITISLQKYLRPFKKFKNEVRLKNQIKMDISLVKKYGTPAF